MNIFSIPKTKLIGLALIMTMLAVFLYLIARTVLFIIEPYLWFEKNRCVLSALR